MVVLVYLMSFSLCIAKDAFAQENNAKLEMSLDQNSNNSHAEAQNQNQTGNKPENVNITCTDRTVYDQTDVSSDNQTMRATNGINDTNANGTTANIPTNASQ